MTPTVKSAIDKASKLHTNLSILHGVVGLLESGCIYSGQERTDAAVSKIIAICKKEASLIVREYDEAVAFAVELQEKGF